MARVEKDKTELTPEERARIKGYFLLLDDTLNETEALLREAGDLKGSLKAARTHQTAARARNPKPGSN